MNEKNEKIKNELIAMVMRQTTYTHQETLDLLNKYNGDYMKVIKEFMKEDSNKEDSNKEDSNKEDSNNININQQIYKEIRTLMDDASRNHRKKIEFAKKRELYEQIIKQRNMVNNSCENKDHDENKKI